MRLLRALTVAAAFASAPSAQFEEFFEDNPIPDLFAGLVTLTLTEQISTADLTVESETAGVEDTELRTFRIPWHADFDVGEREDALRLEAVIGHLSADDAFEINTMSGLSRAEEEWTALGGRFGVGWNEPLGRGWILRPVVGIGLAHLENETTYNAAGQADLAPLIDGVLVNWDAWALTTSATLALERPRDPARLSTGWIASYAYAWTDVFDATSDLQEGTDTSGFGLARMDVGAPVESWGEGAAWDAFGGWVGFDSGAERTLGFDHVFELGGGVTVKPWKGLPPVRLGAAWLRGEDVEGWSFGVSLGS